MSVGVAERIDRGEGAPRVVGGWAKYEGHQRRLQPSPDGLAQLIAPAEAKILRRGMANLTGPVFTQLQAQLAGQPIAGDLQAACNETVDKLLTEATLSSKPGMLLGKIQSGKTKAFIGVLAIAFDNGDDHAVIFTKGTKA